MSKLAIITVVYNNYQVLSEFVSSLKKNSNKEMFLYIVDLSSQKQEIQLIINNQYLIINSENKGYAYGINLGLRQAINDGYEKFVVINDDTYVKPDFVDQCLKSLKNNPDAIIGGKIYYASGFEYHKQRYQKKDLGKVIWFAGGSIDWDNVYIKHKGVDEVDPTPSQPNIGTLLGAQQTDFITGCLMVFDKSVMDKIGYWDESYFLYYEDADWCEHAKKGGIKLIYDPSIVIWHKNAGSTGGSGSVIHQKYQSKNRIKFGLKYAPLKTRIYLIKEFLFSKSKTKD